MTPSDLFRKECPECRILTTFSGGFSGKHPRLFGSFRSTTATGHEHIFSWEVSPNGLPFLNDFEIHLMWEFLGWRNKKHKIREEIDGEISWNIGKLHLQIVGFSVTNLSEFMEGKCLVFRAVVWRSLVAGKGHQRRAHLLSCRFLTG